MVKDFLIVAICAALVYGALLWFYNVLPLYH